MTKAQKVKEPLTFFNLPWYIFALVAVLVLGATYLGVLPTGMTGCFAFMIVLGTIFNWIGDHTPIIKSYLGGGAIVCIFGAGLLVYFHLIPDGTFALPLKENFDLVKGINSFFKGDGGFLDWYIAALITGSILGMNRKLLVKAAARYFPAIFGGLILAFGLCMGVAALMGYPVINALLLVALPIMGGGMGAGATPLSRIFDANPDVAMNAQQAISIMSPAVAIGNAISIVLAGILVKVMVGKLNGKGSLMQTGAMDASELDISPEMKQKREKISLADLGIGLLISGGFFTVGFILQGIWNSLGTGVTIHAYAWMIITVAICKITNIVPERIEVACFQWFQFIMKNFTPMLLIGIGICYLDIGTVISSFSVTYLLLCLATCIGAFVGAALVGKLVGFYPFESGVTAGLCMSNMGGTGDVAVLSAANRMELMPFAQISSRLGGAIILLLASLLLSLLARFIIVPEPAVVEEAVTGAVNVIRTLVG